MCDLKLDYYYFIFTPSSVRGLFPLVFESSRSDRTCSEPSLAFGPRLIRLRFGRSSAPRLLYDIHMSGAAARPRRPFI